MSERKVSQDEIDKVLKQLAQIREPDNMPTEEEIEEMIIRMKKRWGILCTQ